MAVRAPIEQPGDSHRAIAIVPDEQFITSVPGERHGNVLARQTRKMHRRNRGAVRERFVAIPDQFGQDLQPGRFDNQFSVVGGVERRRLTRIRTFVELRLRESDREGTNRLGAQLRHQSDDQSGIDTAGKKCSQGDIAAQTQSPVVSPQ